MVWKTFGHQQIKRVLDLQCESGVFSHAYLFFGSQGLGKKMLAMELAEKILQTAQVMAHPDFIFLDCQPSFELETLREFMQRLSFKPFIGRYKVAIINGAENLNAQSQNALLKTLEEPSPSTILILVSCQRLLPTILSRCQIMNFNRFSQRQMHSWQKANNITATENQLIQAFGLPGRLSQAVNPETDNLLALLQKLKTASRAERLNQVTAYAEQESPALAVLLQNFAQQQILNLAQQPKNYQAVILSLKAREGLAKNLNKKLVLQKFLLEI